jgi:hypothetical protein
MPHLVEMVQKLNNKDFAMIGIDTSNRPEMSREWVTSIGAQIWPHLMDDQNLSKKSYGVQGVPANLFIDRKGRIVFRTAGFREGDQAAIEQMVRALLDRAG